MKHTRLIQLVNELAKGIMQGTEEPFKYELCPKFDNCSHKVEKKCIFDYKNCLTYMQRRIN